MDGKKVFCFVLAKEIFNRGNIKEGEQKLNNLCQSGDPFSCTFLGINDLFKTSFAGTFSKENEYFNRACKQDHTEACVRLESQLLGNKPKDIKRLLDLADSRDLKNNPDLQNLIYFAILRTSPVQAKAVANKYCQVGNADQCFFLASEQDRSQSVVQEHCEKGSPSACYQLAGREHSNRNEEAAFAHLLKACALNDSRGCSRVIKMIEAKKDFQTTEKFLKLLIQKRNSGGSMGWATYHHKRKNYKEAIPYYEVTCYLNFAGSCHLLSDVYSDLKDEKKSSQMADKACSLKVSDGCIKQGKYEMQEHRPKTAKTYYGKACDLKNFDGCLSACYLEAREGNYESAMAVLRKGCSFAIDKKEICRGIDSIAKDQVTTICKAQ